MLCTEMLCENCILQYADEHFWHPKNPLSKENSDKPASLDTGRSFLWIFMILISLGYFLIALTAYIKDLTSAFESFLIFAVGILYSDMLRLNYRIENIEKKKNKSKSRKVYK